jgi:dephospho-CoA kinase
MGRKKLILGITGTNGAGKGTVVEYLVKQKGFKHFSASGLITEEIIKRKMPVNRDNMILVGNDLRVKNGAGYIAEELIKRASNNKNDSIIESIRILSEVDKLREKGGILLAVDADQKLRYKRILLRGGDKDKVSLEQFVAQEKLEMKSNDQNKQNLLACIKETNYLIENNGTFEELNREIEKLLVKINSNGE